MVFLYQDFCKQVCTYKGKSQQMVLVSNLHTETRLQMTKWQHTGEMFMWSIGKETNNGFFFFSFAVLEIEFRASYLVVEHSSTWAMSPSQILNVKVFNRKFTKKMVRELAITYKLFTYEMENSLGTRRVSPRSAGQQLHR
jgi:hypothetical protein